MDKAWTELRDQLHPVAGGNTALRHSTASTPSSMAGYDQRKTGCGAAGLQVSQFLDAMLIRSGPGRQIPLAVAFAVVGILSAAVAIWWPNTNPGHGVFVTGMALFALALLLTAAYLPFSAEELRIDGRGILKLRSWAGLVVAGRFLPSRDIRRLRVEAASAIQSPGRRSYRLVAGGDFGSRCLLELSADRALLETLRQQIMVAASLSRERLAD